MMQTKQIFGYFLTVLALGPAFAAPVLSNLLPFNPPISSVASDPSEPSLALNLLGRMGVWVLTSSLDASRLRLQLGDSRVDYSDSSGWLNSSGEALDLPSPQTIDGQTVVALRVLEALGAKLSLPGNVINPVIGNLVPQGIGSPVPQDAINLEFVNVLPPGGFNQVLSWQATRRPNGVSLNLSRAADWRVEEQAQQRIKVRLRDTVALEAALPVGGDGLSRARIWQSGNDAILELELTSRAEARITVAGTSLSIECEPRADLTAPGPGATPLGVNYAVSPAGKSKLHLVTIDPTRYAPKVLAAPWGGAKTALEFATDSGAVVAVNGGYFDPPTLQAVDYLVSNHQLLSYWRGTRAGVAFAPSGVLWGAPRSRLIVEVSSGKYTVNSVQPTPNSKYLTMFVGDGFNKVGGLGFTTLSIASGAIRSSTDAAFTPALGEITLTFDPTALPALQNETIGSTANVTLNSSDAAWLGATDALAAGPRLISGGAFAVNGKLEGFDTSGEIWRATRQVAFGVDARGWYVVAMLELGTPEEFADALIKAGLRDALRMDSGTSAQIALSGGLIGARWARTVPNALAFVAK